MRHFAIAGMLLFLSLLGLGVCTGWQANNASQAVDINPFAGGSGTPAISPSNGPGYSNGDALDMRTKH